LKSLLLGGSTLNNAPNSEALVRGVLLEHGRLNRDALTLDADADLYQAGMNSHASVNVMLALEATFAVEFPDHMLTRNVFRSIQSIADAVSHLSRTATVP
jgi:acyl carrier protein